MGEYACTSFLLATGPTIGTRLSWSSIHLTKGAWGYWRSMSLLQAMLCFLADRCARWAYLPPCCIISWLSLWSGKLCIGSSKFGVSGELVVDEDEDELFSKDKCGVMGVETCQWEWVERKMKTQISGEAKELEVTQNQIWHSHVMCIICTPLHNVDPVGDMLALILQGISLTYRINYLY